MVVDRSRVACLALSPRGARCRELLLDCSSRRGGWGLEALKVVVEAVVAVAKWRAEGESGESAAAEAEEEEEEGWASKSRSRVAKRCQCWRDEVRREQGI